MTNQHRATSDQWERVEHWGKAPEESGGAIDSCILELRDRVAALEAAQQCRFVEIDTSQWTDEERQRVMEQLDQPDAFRVLTAEEVAPVVVPVSAPADSLVGRVAKAMACNYPEEWTTEARAAIREVAAWMAWHNATIANGSQWADMLRNEAER